MTASVKLLAGDLDAFGNLTAGSLAKAIEDQVLVSVPLAVNEDPVLRRRLIVGIAKGIVAHLKANEQAFVVPASSIDFPCRIDVWP